MSSLLLSSTTNPAAFKKEIRNPSVCFSLWHLLALGLQKLEPSILSYSDPFITERTIEFPNVFFDCSANPLFFFDNLNKKYFIRWGGNGSYSFRFSCFRSATNAARNEVVSLSLLTLPFLSSQNFPSGEVHLQNLSSCIVATS